MPYYDQACDVYGLCVVAENVTEFEGEEPEDRWTHADPNPRGVYEPPS